MWHENLTSFTNLSHQHPTCPNTSQQDGQTRSTCCAQQCCDRLARALCSWLKAATNFKNYLGLVRTTPKEFENRDASNVFRAHYAGGISKTQQSKVTLDLCLTKTRSGKSRDYVTRGNGWEYKIETAHWSQRRIWPKLNKWNKGLNYFKQNCPVYRF